MCIKRLILELADLKIQTKYMVVVVIVFSYNREIQFLRHKKLDSMQKDKRDQPFIFVSFWFISIWYILCYSVTLLMLLIRCFAYFCCLILKVNKKKSKRREKKLYWYLVRTLYPINKMQERKKESKSLSKIDRFSVM